MPGLPRVEGIDRPSVPVEVPAPVGEAPSPVSVGTMTLLADEGAGGGNPPSAVTGAADARGGGALEEVDPHATDNRASAPRTPGQDRQSDDIRVI